LTWACNELKDAQSAALSASWRFRDWMGVGPVGLKVQSDFELSL
jgi:hypothetical protein